MKQIFTASLLLLMVNSFGQKGLDEMIATEKSFAAYSVANNTVDAFLKFMDTSAVMFRNGEPYQAYADWRKKEKRPGVLNWWPTYAEISTGGDFGYTCGPWTFQPTSVKDPVAARGLFFTIWKKNKNGEWKFILDVGTDSGAAANSQSITRITKTKSAGVQRSLLEAEESFLTLYKQDEVKAYTEYMSGNVVIAAEGKRLMPSWATWRYTKEPTPGKIEYRFLGSGIAPGRDLGYTYGTAILNGKKETYFRIWRHEPSGWKIALQMVRL